MLNVLKAMLRDFRIIKKLYLISLLTFISLLTVGEIFSKMELNDMKLLWISLLYLLTIQSQVCKTKFDLVSLSLPVKRSVNVIALYLSFFLLFTLSGFIVAGLNKILFNFGLLTEVHLITFKAGISNYVSNIVFLGIFLPFFFKIGDFMKAILYSLLIFVPILILAGNIGSENLVSFPKISITPFIILGNLTAAYFLSMLLSIKFYEKREF